MRGGLAEDPCQPESPVHAPLAVGQAAPGGVLVLAAPAVLHPVTLQLRVQTQVLAPEVLRVCARLAAGARVQARPGAEVGVDALAAPLLGSLLAICPAVGVLRPRVHHAPAVADVGLVKYLVGVVAAGSGDGQVAAVHGEDALAAGGAVAAQPAVAALGVGHPAAAYHPRPELL